MIADNTIELTPGYLVAPSGEIIDFDGVQNDESDEVLEFTQSRKRFKFRDDSIFCDNNSNIPNYCYY